MSASVALSVAVVAGIVVFSLLLKIMHQTRNALMLGTLCGILIYLALPKNPSTGQVPAAGAGVGADEPTGPAKAPPARDFKSLKDLKQELGASEKAMDQRLKELEGLVED